MTRIRTRDEMHLYPIQNGIRNWISAGLTGDGRQVLMGIYSPELIAIFFDPFGKLLDAQKRPLKFIDEDIQRGYAPDLRDDRIGEVLSLWQDELGYQPQRILVRKFFILEESSGNVGPWTREGIGIEDYPSFWLEVLTNPSAFDEDEKNMVRTEMPRWDREGQFVLWWGNDYWIDGTGELVAS
jgi:hypothetical protein